MTTIRMRCYLLAIRCLRTKCCVIFALFSFIFLLGRMYQLRRYQIFSSMLKKHEDVSINVFTNLSKSRHFTAGMFLQNFVPQNFSYCKYRFGLPKTLEINESDIEFPPELREESDYRIIYNIVEPAYNTTKYDNNVTYCTHATPEFFYYLAEILYRWEGPVSIATFVPSTDATLILCILDRLCSCLPDMVRVSLHFVFPSKYAPKLLSCPPSIADTPSCIVPKIIVNKNIQTFRYSEELTYPVNVARNAARVQSLTKYTLVSDVELLPSRNLVTNFMKMVNALEKNSKFGLQEFVNRLVYVLPVFEVQSNEIVPEVKSKLLELYSQNQAFYFHRWVCSHCQRFPGLQRWLLKKSKVLDNTIQPFFVVRREFPFHRWEPVFIGTNSEPLYSELLTWEGQQDKMTQMHEMCLMKYHFVILDGAFMVHSPGVKRKVDVLRDSWRNFQQKKNSFYYDLIMKNINEKQKKNSRCKIH
ncbi:beta-1,4-glucuronyltransferase 1-like [Cimex lectularius]|uniref:N-acetyllactosaminide beta-1,3-N-acetylglucosaminyltransferase n=1 Tax=Cimex lectularius TaxID=79782 RepID=A0A8I6S8D6_CIMLE|nr:beta-1,4-glucuronyltransferase 1-like [Cimex lectularius]